MSERDIEELGKALAELKKEFQEHLAKDDERDKLVAQIWKGRLLYLIVMVGLSAAVIGALAIVLLFGLN
ncbi:hypothetical protein ACFLX5_02465 [Chloroflexota bacterium]